MCNCLACFGKSEVGVRSHLVITEATRNKVIALADLDALKV